MHDILIVGGGPAGMTAALYAQRNGRSAMVIEKNGFGGQITHSPRVENYPGTLSMSGNEFADRMLEQILAQGADIELETVTEIRDEGAVKAVFTAEGSRFEGRAVVLATGVEHRMLGLPGETELVGEGISFCAVCDGDFYAGRDVCVAGGGNSALQEALLLSEKCRSVTVLQDLPACTGEQRLQDILFAKPNVRLRTGVKITGLLRGEEGLAGVEITGADGAAETVPCGGLFVAIGLIPKNEAFAAFADLDAQGYFAADERCLTRTPGVFVAGDCRAKGVRQVATAIADGATAALAACRYISGL
ncbi:MAG: NAD(P)/FAD-dependent oxidoreductase [Clostridia bacterium]|nr:NAD(P)/FAD-dependent oxidoreductase [Clostridia bacterium]